MNGLLTWAELADRWGCSPRTARRWARRMRLHPLDLGHRTKRFRPEDVAAAERRLAS